jgi:hypothetical protein
MAADDRQKRVWIGILVFLGFDSAAHAALLRHTRDQIRKRASLHALSIGAKHLDEQSLDGVIIDVRIDIVVVKVDVDGLRGDA